MRSGDVISSTISMVIASRRHVAGLAIFTVSYSRFFFGGLEHIFPNDVINCPNPQKTILAWIQVVWAMKLKIGLTVWPVCRIDKKNRTAKNVTKELYFTHLGRSPRWTEFNQNVRGVWCRQRNHVCQVSCLNSHGLRFYKGSNLYTVSGKNVSTITLASLRFL